MKILVLMPLDEKSVYMSAGIVRQLPEEVRETTFAMPMFMEYLIQTKTSENWMYAYMDSLISAKSIYKTADAKGEDVIIIGNMPVDYKFDAVFNFQDIEKDLPYDDPFAAKMRELCKDDETLEPFTNLHKTDESTFTLHNCGATADFLAAYIKTDPHLEEIKAKYKESLNLKDE